MAGKMRDPSDWVKNEDGWNYENHLKERQDNGFSKADWINFDTYIAWVIASAVQKMKDDGNTAFYYPDEPMDTWEELTHAEYDIMIKGFGQYVDATRSDDADWEVVEEKLDKALDIFKKRFKSLWV